MNLLNLINTVEINPTELCNLKCSFCPRSTFYPNQNIHMSVDIARKIRKHLEEINFNGKLSITGRGEPTLGKNFTEIANIFIPNRTWKLKINTNGYKISKVLKTLKEFDEVRVNFYENDYSKFLDIKNNYSNLENFYFFYSPDSNWEEKDKFTNRAGSFDANQKFTGYCDRVFTKLFIDHNGDYKLCCEDWKDHITLGNINSESILQYVLNNEKLENFRNKLNRGIRDMLPCVNCSYKTECSIS